MPHPTPAARSDRECRCHCGSLLGRWVEGGVELKCRRCKRTTWIPLATDWRAPSKQPQARVTETRIGESRAADPR